MYLASHQTNRFCFSVLFCVLTFICCTPFCAGQVESVSVQAKTDLSEPVVKNGKKKVVFLSGNRSHGFGSHEHYAGCRLLAADLQAAFPNIEVEVYKHHWPKDWSVISSAGASVIYSDGGKRHPSLKFR